MKKLTITIFAETDKNILNILDYVQEMLEDERSEKTLWNEGYLEYSLVDDAEQEYETKKP